MPQMLKKSDRYIAVQPVKGSKEKLGVWLHKGMWISASKLYVEANVLFCTLYQKNIDILNDVEKMYPSSL